MTPLTASCQGLSRRRRCEVALISGLSVWLAKTLTQHSFEALEQCQQQRAGPWNPYPAFQGTTYSGALSRLRHSGCVEVHGSGFPWVSLLWGEWLTNSLQLPHLCTQCGIRAEATLFPGCFRSMTEYRGWLEPGHFFPMWSSFPVWSLCSSSSHQRDFLCVA